MLELPVKTTVGSVVDFSNSRSAIIPISEAKRVGSWPLTAVE
jgi:hypothetical protein